MASDPNAAVIFYTARVYNITNGDAFVAGAKPALQELPPLSFLYLNDKSNVSWDPEDDGDVVSFRQYQRYVPADAATEAAGAAPLLTVNLPLLSVLTDEFAASIVASTPALAASVLFRIHPSIFIFLHP